MAHVYDAPPPPSSVLAEVPPDLDAVLLRCLSKDPNDRFPDAAQSRPALANAVAPGSWSDADAEAWWRVHPVPGA